jgi:hypothetical protein
MTPTDDHEIPVAATTLRFSERMMRDKAERVLASPEDFGATTVEFSYYLVTLTDRIGRMRAAEADAEALLADTLVLMDQHVSAEVQMEARRRIIERHRTVSGV